MTPQFGGTSGVTALDIGQVGSTLRAAGNLHATVIVRQDADQTRIAENALPQQAIVYQDRLGPAGRPVRWECHIRVAAMSDLYSLESRLNRYLHGYSIVDGVTGAWDETYIRETRLTDGYGHVLSERATMQRWNYTDRVRRLTGGDYYAVAQLAIAFKGLA